MKTSKIIKLVVDKESLTSHFGLDWLNDQLGAFVIECRSYDDFHVFDIPDNKKIRVLLAEMIVSLSLLIDIYIEDVEGIASLIRDIAHALRR